MNKKPNLLVIHTDQQNLWTIGAYGGIVDTPNTDFIGKEGAIFNNFFTNSAICTPSRGCMITGRYPHAHGAYQNCAELNRDETTIAHVLNENGYDTGYVGKWHLDGMSRKWIDPERTMGFNDALMYNRSGWKSVIENENGEPELSMEIGDENTYITDYFTQKAVDFINKPRNKPFFLMLSIRDPHPKYAVREPYDSMYKPEDMPVPESFYEENRPEWVKKSKRDIHHKEWTEKDIKEIKAQYCGEVKCLDDNIGKLLECLSRNKLMDDTIIIFTTDHGDYMGEHGLQSKNELYEVAYRIPLLIRWPEKIKKGTVINRMVSMVDFQQTVLGLMGIKPCGREQGRDASPFLTGTETEWKDEVFLHHDSFERAGIVTREYQLAYIKDSEHILFDRVNDPLQMTNLFYDPEYKDIIEKLSSRIMKHHREVDSPAAEWLEKVIDS